MGSLKTFPISMKVSGRRIVVVGGGEAAAAKLRLLAKTEARVEVYAPHPAEVSPVAQAAGFEVHARYPERGELTGAVLAFIATEDEPLDRHYGALARVAGVPVNVVDRPELCDVLTPAIIDRAPVTVAISTEGAAPVLAGLLRTRIEGLLPPMLGTLAGLAGQLRDRVAELLPPGRKRLDFWRAYFSREDMAEAASRGEAATRRHALRLLDETRSGASAPGRVWFVGAGPGAADLLTLRAQRVLAEADIVLFDGPMDPAVLDHMRRDARRVDVGRRIETAVGRAEIDGLLIAEARAGSAVVRLTAGDPLARGYVGGTTGALRDAGIEWSIVPGVAAPAESLAA